MVATFMNWADNKPIIQGFVLEFSYCCYAAGKRL